MKRIVLTAFTAVFVFTAVNAQEITERKQDKPALQEHKKGMDDLNLTADQKEKIKSLKQAHQQQIDEMKKEGASQDKIDGVKKQHQDEVMALLTDDQKAEWKKIKDARKAEMKEEKAKDKAAMATADQKSAKAETQQSIKEKIKAIQQDPTLTEDQKRDKTKELVQLLKQGQKTEISDKEAEKLKDQKKHTIDKKTSN